MFFYWLNSECQDFANAPHIATRKLNTKKQLSGVSSGFKFFIVEAFSEKALAAQGVRYC